jgi:hypothetical protein
MVALGVKSHERFVSTKKRFVPGIRCPGPDPPVIASGQPSRAVLGWIFLLDRFLLR